MKTIALALQPSDLAVLGGACGADSEAILLTGAPEASFGFTTIHCTGWESLPPADEAARALADLVRGADRLIAVTSMAARELVPGLAAHAGAACLSDVVEILSETRFRRPIAAGAAFAEVEVDGPVFFTIRPSGFPAAEPTGEASVADLALPAPGLERITVAAARRVGRPDLARAKVVVSGGKPLGDSETFERVIGGMADALGGAVGATRAAVDSGIAANELQVGQTGKVVAPDLYIAAGISGSTQHMAGIKDSKVIVAINKDADAPICSQADLVLVADLFEAVPALQKLLASR
ncbi:MAG: FAD-binding protein [Fimbriimonadaceae bacterium]|nr:FAD-binding protein [Fimbriimonadaceae bacterium]